MRYTIETSHGTAEVRIGRKGEEGNVGSYPYRCPEGKEGYRVEVWHLRVEPGTRAHYPKIDFWVTGTSHEDVFAQVEQTLRERLEAGPGDSGEGGGSWSGMFGARTGVNPNSD